MPKGIPSRTRRIRAMLLGTWLLGMAGGFLSPDLAAQAVGTAIQGTVTDSSGAVIPGAAITVTNNETNLQRTVTSNSAGLYSLPNLPPGRYRVQVSMAGFQTNVRENFELVVGQQLVLNTALEVGEITQQVTVTGEAPLVNTSTAQVTGLVAEREVKDLPLNGRSFDNLITLNPGAVNATALKGQGANGAMGAGQSFAVAGRRPGENVFCGMEWNFRAAPGAGGPALSGKQQILRSAQDDSLWSLGNTKRRVAVYTNKENALVVVAFALLLDFDIQPFHFLVEGGEGDLEAFGGTPPSSPW